MILRARPSHHAFRFRNRNRSRSRFRIRRRPNVDARTHRLVQQLPIVGSDPQDGPVGPSEPGLHGVLASGTGGVNVEDVELLVHVAFGRGSREGRVEFLGRELVEDTGDGASGGIPELGVVISSRQVDSKEKGEEER